MEYSGGLGYIVLPTDITRDEYLSYSLKTLTVSIQLQDGSFYTRVPVPPSIIGFLVFPKKIGEFGTTIIWVCDSMSGRLVVVNYLTSPDELQDYKEGQFKLQKQEGDQQVAIVGSAKGKTLTLLVDGGSQEGHLLLKSTSKKKNSKTTIETLGNCKVVTSNELEFETFKQTKVTTSNSTGKKKTTFTQTDTLQKFEGEKFQIDNGESPMVKGNELKSLLSDFFDEVAGAKVVIGPTGAIVPLLNSVAIAAYKSKLDKILSTKASLE